MGQAIKKTLQLILNSIDKPAFIVSKEKVILTNNEFSEKGFTIANYRDQARENHCEIVEKDIEENMILCEIISCDDYLLQQSLLKLNQAMALL
jgi:hypothetical protein